MSFANSSPSKCGNSMTTCTHVAIGEHMTGNPKAHTSTVKSPSIP